MFKRFSKIVSENNLLAGGEAVLIGFSGGPDSVALLHLLTRLRKKMKLELTAVYINHSIRKRAALQEEKFCQRLCDKFGVVLDIVTENIPALAEKKKKGLEETAREFRYEVYELLATEDGHDKIALGHHADDRVETVLFRIIRGTGPTGLTGIPIKRDKYIRPLFEFTKEEILAYLKKYRLDYCVDKSNLTAEYSRNFIRNKLLPLVREKLNPRFDSALLNLSEIIRTEEEYLEEVVEKNVKKAVNITIGGKFEVALDLFKGYALWLKRRILRFCLMSLSGQNLAPDKEVIDRLINPDKKTQSLPGGFQAVVTADKLVIYRRVKAIVARAELNFDEPLEPEGLRLKIRARRALKKNVTLSRQKRSKKIMLDESRVSLPLCVRRIRPGDRFRPLGLAGSKKVGDYLTDKKVPSVYRDEIPVVCDKEGIIWLVGYEIADRVKVDHQTKKVITIEVSSGK
ncbi:MAG: tRNA lysidine(34) synthetase TilS [candidate division Zixibacteria bacterium]|nr:tRNA lysidine(34) synthetase TilS [candidate division Zixibacteria bacterium]